MRPSPSQPARPANVAHSIQSKTIESAGIAVGSVVVPTAQGTHFCQNILAVFLFFFGALDLWYQPAVER